MASEWSFGGILKFCVTVISGGCKNSHFSVWNSWTELKIEILPTEYSAETSSENKLVKISD